jgi:hypothetical protein
VIALLPRVGHTGVGGANQLPTSASVGNGEYTWKLSYDGRARMNEDMVSETGAS